LVSKETSQKTVSNILKLIVIATGAVCTSLVLIIEHLGGLLKLAISLGGITNGPLLAMFTMGMLFPKANSKVESGTYIAKSKIGIFLFKGSILWSYWRINFYLGIGDPCKILRVPRTVQVSTQTAVHKQLRFFESFGTSKLFIF
jgi:hypothetical protein